MCVPAFRDAPHLKKNEYKLNLDQNLFWQVLHQKLVSIKSGHSLSVIDGAHSLD